MSEPRACWTMIYRVQLLMKQCQLHAAAIAPSALGGIFSPCPWQRGTICPEDCLYPVRAYKPSGRSMSGGGGRGGGARARILQEAQSMLFVHTVNCNGKYCMFFVFSH